MKGAQRYALTVLLSAGLCAQDIHALLEEAKQSYTKVSRNILKSADWMPEKDYSFRPTPTSPSFGQLIHEVADAQGRACAAIQGGTFWRGYGPYSPSKANLLDILKRSTAACDTAYNSVNATNANEKVQFGTGWYSKLGLLFLNASHDNELYGQLAVYLRMNGIAPPSGGVRVVPLD